ncbi:hypothetical protein BDV18DRAFT_158355 [Aspergillus unguis]
MTRRAKTRKAQCSFCPKTFTRTEHLQRHLGSHGVGEAVACPECGKGFMRKDVMKRHFEKCRLKANSAVDGGQSTAMQASLPTLPDPVQLQTPASATASVSVDTTSLALPETPDQGLWNDINFDNIQFLLDPPFLDRTENRAHYQPSGFGIPCINIDPAETFNFLARFSDKESTSLKTRYGCPSDSAMHPAADGSPDGISNQIIDQIKTVSQASSITVPWTPQLSKDCARFFSPSNIARFINIYWTAWHPHYPALHKPTFSLSCTPVCLAAAMVVIGACFSPTEIDRISAKLWLNAVEELVFRHRFFGDVLLLDEATVNVREAVQVLQAAYCISTAQITEGSRVGRRRVRRVRFGMIVSLARDLNLFNVSHRNMNTLQDGFCWDSFIATEECIRYVPLPPLLPYSPYLDASNRTMLFIYIHDTGYSIFSNYLPRTRIQEMSLDVACPEACFQASSAEECLSALKSWTSHPLWKHRMRLRDIIETILQPNPPHPNTQAYLSHLGVLNLWIVCSALVSETLTLNSLFSTAPNLAPLRAALDTWKAAWNQRYILTDNFGLPKEEDVLVSQGNLWKRIGFFQNAAEYWLLVHILVQRMEGSGKRPYTSSMGDETASGMVDLKRLILEHQPLRE